MIKNINADKKLFKKINIYCIMLITPMSVTQKSKIKYRLPSLYFCLLS